MIELSAEYKYIPYKRAPFLPNGEALLSMSDADIDTWDAAAVEMDNHNYKVAEPHNRKADAAWLALLNSMGVVTHGTRGGVNAHARKVLSEMHTKAGVNSIPAKSLYYLQFLQWPVPKGYRADAVSQNRTSLREVITYARRINAEADKQAAIQNAANKHWLERGPELGLFLSLFPSVETYIDAVRAEAAKRYVKSREGETLHIDFCDTCSEWTVGEARCSCGNRRVSLTLDWNPRTLSWDAYPEAH